MTMTPLAKPTARTLPALIDELGARHPDRPAVSFADETLDFARFRDRTRAFARGLHAAGVRRGDKVGILMGNRIEWLVANFAIQYLGATTVALNTWYTGPELHYVLDHAEVSTLIVVDRYLKSDYRALLESYEPLAETLPALKRVVMLDDCPDGLPDSLIAWDDLVASGETVPDETVTAAATAVGPEDIAYLLYTSGSTAKPKGVLLRHDGLLDNMWDIGERLHYTADDVIYLPISLFWGLGCENMLMACWTHAMHIVLQDQFDPADAMHLIERHRCTALVGTPNIIHAIFTHPDRPNHDLSTLSKGTASGSPDATRRVIETAMPLACHCYGLTESYGFVTVNDASDPIEKRCVTEGRPLPGFDFIIADPATGEPLPAGQQGEVRIRGHVTPGYYKNPEATAASFDANGYFMTGDLGLLDEGGYLHFKGRLKEMLKTGGMNVAPVEVEEVLRHHPGIAEAFVTGLPDAVLSEAVAAVVVRAPGSAIDAEEVIAHCRASLAAYKVPRHVRFITPEQIPLTTTSKLHRMKLASLFDGPVD